VARRYAGILGSLAFLTTLIRGMLHGGDPETVLWSAWCALLAFALVGGIAGRLAAWIVEDAVRSRFAGIAGVRPNEVVPRSGRRPAVGV
jgi:hypothetical protein